MTAQVREEWRGLEAKSKSTAEKTTPPCLRRKMRRAKLQYTTKATKENFMTQDNKLTGEEALLKFVADAHKRITAIQGLILILIQTAANREDLTILIADLAKSNAQDESSKIISEEYFRLLEQLSELKKS
ncbi:hypothetical protein GN325_20705 [Agrobacterium vitis]|uniref:hypothetical protein n=1 Tax=Agrobacterium vitis TaxID=373 RepID=UPI0012E8D957|nr:hypothetical protein [Agrobacterium vitis]MVB04188.1 hypothetical protein [Agrobacterium vitis]NSY10810.1 hypothetical protein [Agrobacterium vitis]